VAAALAVTAGLAVPAAGVAKRGMLVGIFDEAHTLYGEPEETFPMLQSLRVQVLRVGLYWGGKFGVAKRRPFDAADPADPAYDWRLYDRVVRYASQHRIQVLFSIYGTPGWANSERGLNRIPASFDDLKAFAYAAATRYSGTYPSRTGELLPGVRYWLAWNEPNNPVFLQPQYARVGRRWVIQSARDYAKICKAVYDGVHGTLLQGERVGCGATSPRGNNSPRSPRPSVAPLAFLRALSGAGLKTFDAYAHHPYYGAPRETPATKPGNGTAVTLANIGLLISELNRRWTNRRVWITEYGYQTNPPDRTFGVSWALQAHYLKEAFSIARRNPRIDMMLWFMLQDESLLGGWQSGLISATGQKKPSYTAFLQLPR